MPIQENLSLLRNIQKEIVSSLNRVNSAVTVLESSSTNNHSTQIEHLASIDTAVNQVDAKVSTEAKQDDIITELKDIEANQTNGHKVLCFGNTNPADPASGVYEAIHTDGNGNVNTQVINTLSVNAYRRDIASGATNQHALVNADGHQYSNIFGVDYLGTTRQLAVDIQGKLLTQVDGQRQTATETFTVGAGSTGTSSSIAMGTHTRIAFYGNSDNLTDLQFDIEYSNDGSTYFKGAGDNAKVIVIGSNGDFYDEEIVTPPFVRLSKNNTTGSLETVQLKYTRL